VEAAGQAATCTLTGVRPEMPEGHSELASQTETQYCRSVAQVGVQVAEALAYAHKQRILHRDIKPSNLLLDTRGTVWITDFGLAKAEGSDDLTSTGDIVGTLRFMAPERFQGEADPRSDVYSTGITLYEMLTLRPAFADSNRAGLIERVTHQDPPRPRKLDPHIPRDLETIVLKAIAKAPADRYPSAEALAEDLRRFLADRPIWARRTSLAERTWRWCRRNPAVASLLGSVAFLVTAVAIVSSVFALLLDKEAHRAREAERDAKEKLCQSYRDQAKAGRLSRRVGQRLDSLAALAKAAKIAHELNLSEERFRDLRNEAIACLALPDLGVAKEWNGWPTGTLAVDFDGALERYARLDRQGIVSIRGVADDREIQRVVAMKGTDWVELSHNGRFLVVGGKDRLELWNLIGPEPSLIHEEREQYANSTRAFSRDSHQFAFSRKDGVIILYDLASSQEIRRFEVGAQPRFLAFHPTRRQLALALRDRVQVRDLDTGVKLVEFRLRSFTWPKVAWHPDGKTLAAASGDLVIYLWDVATGKEIVKLEGHKNGGVQFTFNHAGDLLASTSWGGMLRLWDSRTGKQLFSTQLQMAPPTKVRFSPDDRLLAAGCIGQKLQILEVIAGREYRTLVRDPVLGKTVYSQISVSTDGRLVAVGMDDGFCLWDLRSGKQVAFSGLPIINALLEPSGALLTNGRPGLLRWPVQTDATAPRSVRIGPPQRLPLPATPHELATSRDGRVIASPQGWGAFVLDLDRLQQPVRLSPHEGAQCCAVSPDGRRVATASSGLSTVVKIWKARSGELVKNLPVGGSRTRVAFSPDGQWLATSGERIWVWQVGSWQEQVRLEEPHARGLAFSPDSRILAFETSNGFIRLVDPATGREYARLEDPDQDRAYQITFSPDGTKLATSTHTTGSVHVWDLRAIRTWLADKGLDWDLPPYEPVKDGNVAKPLVVKVDLGNAFHLLTGDDRTSIGLNSFLLALNPFNPDAYLQRGLAYGRLKESAKAIADYSMFLALTRPQDKRRAEVLLRRSNNYKALNQDARSLADVLQLVKLNPDGFGAFQEPLAGRCNELARHLVTGPEKERDSVKALLLAQKAVALSPQERHYLNTLGVVYYRLGRYEEATATLERSARHSHGHAADLFFLAMCHARRGAAAKAKDCYDRAVAWQQQARLPPQQVEELKEFQTEAEGLLSKR
jgi:WD40 repeat protein